MSEKIIDVGMRHLREALEQTQDNIAKGYENARVCLLEEMDRERALWRSKEITYQVTIEDLRSRKETFDQATVREMLDAEHSWRECSNSRYPNGAAIETAYDRWRLALQRVRESERKL